MTFVGSEKMAIYDDLAADKLLVFDSGAATAPAASGRLEPRYRFGEGQAVPLARTDEPLRRQCAYFLDCVREGRQPAPDGRFGLKVVRVLEQATRSMQNAGRREHIVWDAPAQLSMRQSAAAPPCDASQRRAAS